MPTHIEITNDFKAFAKLCGSPFPMHYSFVDMVNRTQEVIEWIKERATKPIPETFEGWCISIKRGAK